MGEHVPADSPIGQAVTYLITAMVIIGARRVQGHLLKRVRTSSGPSSYGAAPPCASPTHRWPVTWLLGLPFSDALSGVHVPVW